MTRRTVTDNANTIVNTSIDTDAKGDPMNALGDDDQRWLETVLASLKGRSREAQEALREALENGPTLENPAGLTTFYHATEIAGEPSPERSETSVVYTVGLHNRPNDAGENTQESSSFTRRDQGAKRIDMVE